MRSRLLALILGLTFLTGAIYCERLALERRAQLPAEDDSLFLPHPSVLRLLSLGHFELMADLVFIRAIIYFGSQFQSKGEYRWLDHYLDTIVKLDPNFKTPYRWAGVATIYNGQDIANDRVAISNHFLELGAARFPSDWELPFMLGCNYLFEMKTNDKEQHAQWQKTGGAWVRRAAMLPQAPSWIPLLAATIMRQEGREEAAVRHLEEVYLTTQDDKARAEIYNRLLTMKTRLDLSRSEAEHKKLDDAQKATLPYVPSDLFVIVGPKPSARMDLKTLSYDPVVDQTED